MRFRCIRSDDKMILKFFTDGFFKECFNHWRRLSFFLKAKGSKVNFTNVVVENIKYVRQSDDLVRGYVQICKQPCKSLLIFLIKLDAEVQRLPK
ncbi:hypothetical protein AVEN_695-1 [Araneus ventricosus]|uniref:Uncharacterized protein n=1 Tax=Araneus ventricosus TaxID=182803 RepID=A0A4Y2BUJ5_ARAVE|nr:hypothetical protein AVEN_695-1 [Araneus ventricosus]